MAREDDVAAAVLARVGEMTTWKLQKLVYYVQAWHLVRYGRPLFSEPIEAWRNGPVVRSLYDQHRTSARVRHWPKGDVKRFSNDQQQLLDWVSGKYGALSGETLSEMTHAEAPWSLARGITPRNSPSTRPINLDLMRSFYSRQEAAAGTAVSQAIANSAIEGIELDSDWEESLYDVADGSLTADDLVQREIDRARGV